MPTITVTAKGNLGHSPKFGDIRAGQQYTIEETDFAPELFEVPAGFDPTPYLPQPVVVEPLATEQAPPDLLFEDALLPEEVL